MCSILSRQKRRNTIITEKDICRQFGTALRKHRKLAGITQGILAERVQVSTNYISMIERGKKNPSLVMCNRLANALNLYLASLLPAPE